MNINSLLFSILWHNLTTSESQVFGYKKVYSICKMSISESFQMWLVEMGGLFAQNSALNRQK